MLSPTYNGLTLRAVQRRIFELLASAGRDAAALDARLLLEAATGCDHAGLLRDGDRVIEPGAAEKLVAMAGRRLAGEPLSRILGMREFCGLPIDVRPGVLDPRDDTESLVRLSRRLCNAPRNILDLGTGSGALLCALLHSFTDASGVGIDRSRDACAAARGNCDALGLASRSMIVRGDWADPLAGPFDLIVVNPPYIAQAEIATLPAEVRDHDPALALDGGVDGLAAYRAILSDIGRIAAPGAVLVLEVGAGARKAVETLMSAARFTFLGVERDFGGHDRALAAKID